MEFDHHHRGTAELHNDASPTIDAVHPFTTGDSASTRQVGAAPQLHNTHEQQQQQQQQQQRQNAQRFHFHRQGHEEVAGDESHRSVGDASGTYSHDQLQINLRAISQSHQQRHPSPTGGQVPEETEDSRLHPPPSSLRGHGTPPRRHHQHSSLLLKPRHMKVSPPPPSQLRPLRAFTT